MVKSVSTRTRKGVADKEKEKEEDEVDDVLNEYFNAADEAEPEGEDLYGSDIEKDYERDEGLDTYDEDGIEDDEEIAPLDPAMRRMVDRQIQKKKRKQQRKQLVDKASGTNNRIGLAILSSDDEDEMNLPVPKKRKTNDGAMQPMELEDDEDEIGLWGDLSGSEMSDVESDGEEEVDFSKRKGPLREWLVLDRIRRQISRQFKTFLTTFQNKKGTRVYSGRIEEACMNNKQSFVINFNHLKEGYPYLALCLADAPTEMLQIFDEVCMAVALSHFPFYRNVSKEMKARIIGLPDISLRDLRQVHLNVLIKVCGVVTRRTAVFPQLSLAKYNCIKCQTLLGPFKQSMDREMRPTGSCPQCQSQGPFILNTQETIYQNYQRLSLQESPGSVPAGRLPRTKEVILLGDLIDQVRPGEEIEVTGIFRHNYDLRLNRSQGFPVFATVIEANHVNKTEDLMSSFRLDDKDIRDIKKLSQDERIGERIIRSIAPSIYGHEDIKTAIALSLFGGNSKELVRKGGQVGGKKQTHHRIRGDINVLLMGDPGTAKSQFLKYVEKTGNRTVYTTGQGASAVGLTAAVRKDPTTREWTLEGGALVLADKGVCLIDEFDKMNDKDRTSIHEAMEQQSISISKAGIVTSLQARCAIIAAANPIRGRYDQALTFAQNVDLTEPILSRFDILCTVRDLVDPIQDEQLASFVVDSHIRSHPDPDAELLDILSAESAKKKNQDEYLPQETLRKYIIYAKKYCFPKLHNIDRDRIAKVYAELRKISRRGGGLPMGVRHLESILRIAESNARMHLRSYVREDDVNRAISVIVGSFIQAQKLSTAKLLRTRFSKYITNTKDSDELLLHILQQLMRDEQSHQNSKHGVHAKERVEVALSQLETKARELDILSLHSFFESKQFRNNGFILDGLRKMIGKDF